jgi:uncharacterized protein (DUF924 family)
MAAGNTSTWVSAVLQFWFTELKPRQWFVKDEQLDALIRERFLSVYEHVRQGLFDDKKPSARETLAAVIVLDQFPRNMFRGTPQAFATDAQALAMAQSAIARGEDRELPKKRRVFLYMPFQHSEDRAVQARSIELFTALGENLGYARRHQEVIERFGRFPHRNAILGRASTPEEREFLEHNPGF